MEQTLPKTIDDIVIAIFFLKNGVLHLKRFESYMKIANLNKKCVVSDS